MEKFEKMERMERRKKYYLLANQKQTLVSFDFNGKDLSNVLKFDGKDWVYDDEVNEVVRRCFDLYVMDKIATKIRSDYDYDRILNAKREQRKIEDINKEKELIERIEKRDAEKKTTDTSDTNNTNK